MSSSNQFARWFEQQNTQTSTATESSNKSTGWRSASSKFMNLFNDTESNDIESGNGAATPEEEEQQGLLSGWFGTRSTGSTTGASQPSTTTDDTCGLSRTQRIQAFLILLVGSLTMFSLALFLFLPMILIVPTKFALSFSLGSIMFMSAFALLNGPKHTVKQLCSRDRILFTSMYISSILLTLYTSMVLASYIFTVCSVSIQLSALLWYGATYVPGGRRGMQFLTTICIRSGRKIFQMIAS